MKTAISVPDTLFAAAERLAKRLRISRSRLYAEALSRFVEVHNGTSITEALNRIYANEPSTLDPLLAQIQGASSTEETW